MGFRLRAWILLLAVLSATGVWAEEASGVSVALSFPTKPLKADERLTVPVWLGSSASVPMRVEVELAGPDSVHLLSRSACAPKEAGATGWRGWLDRMGIPGSPPDTCAEGPSTVLGQIAPGKDLKSALCLCVSSEVQEEESKLLFVFRSFKPTGEVSITTVEKEVELGLFGPTSVGGVSLRLMSLFVPGFVFLWLFPLFWGAPVVTGIERGVGAVMISAVLLAISYGWDPPGMPGAISLLRLCTLLLAAAVLAIAGGTVLRQLGRRLLVQPADSTQKAMVKLLRLRCVNHVLKSCGVVYDLTVDNPQVWLADEKVICGCLMGRTSSGWVILPELRIMAKEKTAKEELMRRNGRWSKLLRCAIQQGAGTRIRPGQLQERQKRGSAFEPGEIPQRHVAVKDVLRRESRKGVEWVPVVVD